MEKITKIVAREVVGRFDYELTMGEEENYSEAGRMRVMYAPNGRGKTNFLRTVGRLLSPNPASFYALAEAPVGCVEIQFSNGAQISFTKTEAFAESYMLIFEDAEDSSRSVETTFSVDEFPRRATFRLFRENPKLQLFMARVRELHPGAAWIGADRLVPKLDERQTLANNRRFAADNEDEYSDVLEQLLDELEKDFSSSALKTVRNDQKQVYSAMAESVLDGGTRQGTAIDARLYLETEIGRLLEKGAGSEKFGLISLAELRGIGEQLSVARQNQRWLPTLKTILTPYFKSIQSQLDAMESTRHIVESFISTSNDFLDEKRVTYQSGDGIALHGFSGEELEAASLSSGERHILFLLAKAVLAARKGSLLIVDEPEISLGIDWQRNLLAALMQCSSAPSESGSASHGVQLLVATHSLQVMGEVDPREVVSHS